MNLRQDLSILEQSSNICEVRNGMIKTKIGNFYPIIHETMELCSQAFNDRRRTELCLNDRYKKVASRYYLDLHQNRFYDGHLDGSRFYFKVDGLRIEKMSSWESGWSKKSNYYIKRTYLKEPDLYGSMLVRPDLIKNYGVWENDTAQMFLAVRLFRKISGRDVRDPNKNFFSRGLTNWKWWIREVDHDFFVNCIV